MNAKITVKYEKCPVRYDIYVNGQKIKNGKTIELANNGTIQLLEKNPFLSRCWVLLALFNLICAFFGSFDDFNDVADKQKRITISYGMITADTLTLIIPEELNNIQLNGVDNYAISSTEELQHPIIKKRLKIAKALLIIIPVMILVIIAVVITVTLLIK